LIIKIKSNFIFLYEFSNKKIKFYTNSRIKVSIFLG